MTAFMIYLLIGALWSLICKLSGEIDKILESDDLMSNTLGWQIGMTAVITLFWGPILVSLWLEKRKGEDK